MHGHSLSFVIQKLHLRSKSKHKCVGFIQPNKLSINGESLHITTNFDTMQVYIFILIRLISAWRNNVEGWGKAGKRYSPLCPRKTYQWVDFQRSTMDSHLAYSFLIQDKTIYPMLHQSPIEQSLVGSIRGQTISELS